MKVRRAVPEEAEECWHIRNQAIRYGCSNSFDASIIKAWTPDQMPAGFRSEIIKNPFFVAQIFDKKLVATGFLDVSSASVEAVFTLPNYMGKGLAAAIIEEVKNEARKRDFKQLTLSSTPNATAFYEKRGFVIVQESFYFSEMTQSQLRCVTMRIEL